MAKALSEYYFSASTGEDNALNLFVGKFAPATIKSEATEKLQGVKSFFEGVATLDVREFEKYKGQKFPSQVFDSTLTQFPSLNLHSPTFSYAQLTKACQDRLADGEKKPCLTSAALDFFIQNRVSPKSRADSISYRDTELFLASPDFARFDFSQPLQESLTQFLLALQSGLEDSFNSP